ncbi:3212_t:CDS:2, partial [Gigaspora rosea]
MTDIIREKKVSGRTFIKLTEDKLEEWGIAEVPSILLPHFFTINEDTIHFLETSSKRRKVEEEDMTLPLTTRFRMTYSVPVYWTIWIPMPVWTHPFIWTPAANAWKEGLAHLLGLITAFVILLMNVLSALTSYFDETNIDNWSHISCLEYLAKVCSHLTSEDRIEILNSYKAKLRSISLSKSVLQKSRTKAFKLIEKADRSFKRKEVTLFFEELDTQAYPVTSRKGKHNEEGNGSKTPPLRSSPNEDSLLELRINDKSADVVWAQVGITMHLDDATLY